MKKIVALSALMLALTGCSSTDDSIAQSKSEDKFSCENSRSLGSMIPKKQCSTKKQREEARRDSQEALRESRRVGTLQGSENF